jgi:hypothetical protein
MNVSYLEIGIPNGAAAQCSAEANSSRPRKFGLICLKACEPLFLSPRLPTEANLAQWTWFEPRTAARGSERKLANGLATAAVWEMVVGAKWIVGLR